MSVILKKKSVLDLGRNQIMELVDEHMQSIIENINDLDTDPNKARTLNIKLTFKTDDERSKIDMSSSVDAKLAPKATRAVTLMNVRDEDRLTGEVTHVLKEVTEQIPGQLNLDGLITQQEVVVIGAYADEVIARAQRASYAIEQKPNENMADTAQGGN